MSNIHTMLVGVVFVAMAMFVAVILVMRGLPMMTNLSARFAAQVFARHPIVLAAVGYLRPAVRVFDDMHFGTTFETAQHVIAGPGTGSRV